MLKKKDTSGNQIPLLDGLLAFLEKEQTPFHVPGHKGGKCAPLPLLEFLGPAVFRLDLTEIEPLDHLANPGGIIKRAMELAAKAFNADQTFFLVNGSTVGVLTIILSMAAPGEEILLSRASHLSACGGLILSGAIPRYVRPTFQKDFGFWLPLTASELEQNLLENPGTRAVFLTSPNYYGVCSNLEEIVNLTSACNLKVGVDEAHGAHFPFHPLFPPTAMEAGVDLSVQSAHKTLSSFTQSSFLHWKEGNIPLNCVKSALRLLQSTSPSYLLLVSLDASRWQMEQKGEEFFQKAIELTQEAKKEINRIPGLRTLEEKYLGPQKSWGLDPIKLTINLHEAGFSGFQAARILRKCGVEVELADSWNVLCLVTGGDSEETIEQLVGSLRDLHKYGNEQVGHSPDLEILEPPSLPHQVLTPREAFFSSSEVVPFREAEGRICAEIITPYPPGVPILCPGEEISAESIEYTLEIKECGAEIQGAEDSELRWVRVIQ